MPVDAVFNAAGPAGRVFFTEVTMNMKILVSGVLSIAGAGVAGPRVILARIMMAGVMAAGFSSSAVAVEPPAAPAAAAAPFDLATESEAATWSTAQPKDPTDFNTRELLEAGAMPTCRSVSDNQADNPRINLVAPTVEKPLIPPFDIEVQFSQAGSARIRPETFLVCYLGSVSMDITKRLTDRVAVSEKGLRVTGARLPQGHHRLVFLVADQRGRLARREATFNVL